MHRSSELYEQSRFVPQMLRRILLHLTRARLQPPSIGVMLSQVVGDGEPGRLAPDKDMAAGADPRIAVQGPQGEPEYVWGGIKTGEPFACSGRDGVNGFLTAVR